MSRDDDCDLSPREIASPRDAAHARAHRA